jgi:hypothetical protein
MDNRGYATPSLLLQLLYRLDNMDNRGYATTRLLLVTLPTG